MTVGAELQKSAQRIEHFITIEGIGWPTNDIYGSIAGGFDGVVFATNDIDGDLASKLGCTVYKGLAPPEGISESIDPRVVSYSPSGLNIEIQDNDDWWLENCTPRKQGNATSLTSGITFWNTTIRLDDGTSFSTGDEVWIGGHELVVLGTKTAVAGTVFDYIGSTRGYTGTRRGAAQRRPEDYCMSVWPAGTSVQTVVWWWWNRRVALWAHVPGEAVDYCQCVWVGKLRKVSNPEAGIKWKLSCNGDMISDISRIYRAIDCRASSQLLSGSGTVELPNGSTDVISTASAAYQGKRLIEFGIPGTARFGADGTGLFELANAYQWRTEPGGVDQMVTLWNSGVVLAADVGGETDILYSHVLIGESVYLMIHRETAGSNNSKWSIVAEIVSAAGKSNVLVDSDDRVSATGGLEIAPNTPARFLLDNFREDKYRSRFSVNGVYTNHPIDYALIFMTSADRERASQDAGAGTTASQIQGAFGIAADEANGYALFCMENTYKYEARVINGSSPTAINVSRAFTGTAAVGTEFQIRNSIYDVLPIGWGMGIDGQAIDIESFEAIRDGPLATAKIGKFMIGVQDEIDLWELVNKQLLQPYGVLVYFDYTTRKITARYIGPPSEDGTIEDYTAINTEHIYEVGEVVHNFRNPIGAISLKVRAIEQRIVGTTEDTSSTSHLSSERAVRAAVPTFIGGKTVTLRLRSDEANLVFNDNELDQVEVEALLNTEEDCGPLASRLLGQIGEYSVPPPVWSGAGIDIELYEDCKPGSYVVINWNTPDAPANPLTGTRGWIDIIGRVVGRGYPRKGALHFDLSVELLAANLVGRIAPAAVVTAKGSDGGGAFFTLSSTDLYVEDPDSDEPGDYFEVGDVLEHRDKYGAIKGSWANRAVIAPVAGLKIYVDGAIGSTVAAGDYITFADWSNATTRMKRYSAYADTSAELNGTDQARQYG